MTKNKHVYYTSPTLIHINNLIDKFGNKSRRHETIHAHHHLKTFHQFHLIPNYLPNPNKFSIPTNNHTIFCNFVSISTNMIMVTNVTMSHSTS